MNMHIFSRYLRNLPKISEILGSNFKKMNNRGGGGGGEDYTGLESTYGWNGRTCFKASKRTGFFVPHEQILLYILPV